MYLALSYLISTMQCLAKGIAWLVSLQKLNTSLCFESLFSYVLLVSNQLTKRFPFVNRMAAGLHTLWAISLEDYIKVTRVNLTI